MIQINNIFLSASVICIRGLVDSLLLHVYYYVDVLIKMYTRVSYLRHMFNAMKKKLSEK